MRFPRILRWRQDKPANEANTLQDAQALLQEYVSVGLTQIKDWFKQQGWQPQESDANLGDSATW